MFENEMTREEYLALMKNGKKSKYGSNKIVVDGIKFDSVKEATRWQELKILEKAGEVSNLQRQVKYEVLPVQRDKGKVLERPVYYIADFVYTDTDGNTVCEDTKGYKTKEYIIKRKLMLYMYGIKIKEA